jgi:hypothetical protein
MKIKQTATVCLIVLVFPRMRGRRTTDLFSDVSTSLPFNKRSGLKDY